MSSRARMDEARPAVAGHGEAWGAVTVLNATAAGIGCSLAVQARTTATWRWAEGGLRVQAPQADDRLAQAVWQRLRRLSPRGGAQLAVTCPFPPSRGLKTSSSAAGSLVRAAFAAARADADWRVCATEAVEASLAAGVTLTGAFDDQVATLRGGCHLTDNAARAVLRSFEVPPWHVAIWVPSATIPKAAAARIDALGLAAASRRLASTLSPESIPAALTENGRLFHALYAAHGLPVDDQATRTALAHGALGAGLSGTGPAVAALFDAPAALPRVPGGEWTWTRVAPVQE